MWSGHFQKGVRRSSPEVFSLFLLSLGILYSNFVPSRPGLRGRAAGNFLGHQPIKGAKTSLEIIDVMALVNSGFHTQKNFSRTYPQFEHAALKHWPGLS
jgi:hypothetical protein